MELKTNLLQKILRSRIIIAIYLFFFNMCFRLSFVSLDTAEKYNTGKARAVEVEECTCPIGYRGLSCEDCDVGYTRAIEGLYLGICEPCNCNNHSNQCDPETGTCEVMKIIIIK